MLWEDPPVRKARKGSRNARLQPVIKGSQQQLADAVSTQSLTGLGWADGSMIRPKLWLVLRGERPGTGCMTMWGK